MPRATSLSLLLATVATVATTACESALDPQADPAAATAIVPAVEAPPQPVGVPTIATGSPIALDTPAPRMAARHILVAHETAARKPLHVHRTATAARNKAKQIVQRLTAGEDFEALAKSESDCVSGPSGGFLGAFEAGAMAPAFEATAFALADGEVSGVVESPFGFHVIRREALEEVHIAQILIGFAETDSRSSARGRDEALARAERARARLDAGEDFEDVARDLSDGAAGLRGGDLGWFTRGEHLLDWEERAFSLKLDETTGPFETTAGLHLLRRLE